MKAILTKGYVADGLEYGFDFPNEIEATVTPELQSRIEQASTLLADGIHHIAISDRGLDYDIGNDFRVGFSSIEVSKYGLTLSLQGKHDCSAQVEYELTIGGEGAA
tara:strand:+ start:10798 stop:11115 length:318 start_codon:yes stop_codon:yes gene_type:complete